MTQAIKLLIVDDSDDDAVLLARRFRGADYAPDFLRVDTGEAMAAALKSGPWDAVIADVSMPRFSAMAALDLYRRLHLDIPFLVVSGVIGEEKAVALLKAGAHDFLLKSSLARLVPAFERERREAAIRVAHREAEAARRLGEEQLRRANEKLESAVTAKARFLAAASHDLRQPVQALVCLTDALSRHVTAGPGAAALANLESALASLKELLDALLDVSRLDAGVVVPTLSAVPVVTVMARVHADMLPAAAAKGLRLGMADCTATVRSDPVLLARIMRNLVENAIRYTERGGVLIGCRRRGERLLLGVWDTGIGIPDAYHERIFEEFFQVGNPERDRRKGLGLGLAIVGQLARLLDHPVVVRSHPGRGSAFGVVVPRETARTPARTPVTPVDATRGGCLVVVIDDEAMVATALALVIEGWGFEVEVAGSVEAALETARRLAEAFRHPCAIVADYRLGGGRTGTEAIDAIRTACGRRIPSIVVTGDTAVERLREIQTADATVLYKPVMPADLRQALARITAPAADRS